MKVLEMNISSDFHYLVNMNSTEHGKRSHCNVQLVSLVRQIASSSCCTGGSRSYMLCDEYAPALEFSNIAE